VSDEDFQILVLERTVAEYKWHQRSYQEMFADVYDDPSFARWLADPKSGRFLIIDVLGDSPESTLWNVHTEKEMIEALMGKLFLQLKAFYAGERSHIPKIGADVSVEVKLKLDQMCAEILLALTGSPLE
jgi:hypothetical protein